MAPPLKAQTAYPIWWYEVLFESLCQWNLGHRRDYYNSYPTQSNSLLKGELLLFCWNHKKANCCYLKRKKINPIGGPSLIKQASKQYLIWTNPGGLGCHRFSLITLYCHSVCNVHVETRKKSMEHALLGLVGRSVRRSFGKPVGQSVGRSITFG